MIKVFTLNRNGKIELDEKELKSLLDDAYWEGYRNASHITWTYTSPSIWSPYTYTTSTNGTITLNSTGTDSNCTSATITATNYSNATDGVKVNI